MRATLIGAAAGVLCAVMLTGCGFDPAGAIHNGLPVPPNPNASPEQIQPAHIPEPQPTPGSGAQQGNVPVPTATLVPQTPPVVPHAHYNNPLVLPTCDTISSDGSHPSYEEVTGMDYITPSPSGWYGVTLPAAQTIMDRLGAISCTWYDHTSKRNVTITDAIATAADRAEIASVLGANGFTGGPSGQTINWFTASPDGSVTTDACAWLADEIIEPTDFVICIRDTTGESYGANLQDAEDAFLTVNPQTFS